MTMTMVYLTQRMTTTVITTNDKNGYYFARGSGCDCDEYVCLSVCKDVSGTTHAIFNKFSMHVAYVRGLVFLRHVDDRPHRLLAGRG